MKDPKLYLCIDNCFAYKRWVKPMDWMLLVKEMGAQYVEQSADTECDPLYHGAEYMRGWIRETREASEKTGVQVKNVYSGHGTYCTCGLTHWDPAVRRRFREQWMKPQANTARALEAGFGFYAHGFENSLLQDAAGYEARLEGLYDDLAELARYAGEIGLSYIGLEQMYTPHMPPWTIDGAEELVRQVYARCGAAMYLTVDLGHMNGQQFFPWPREEQILEAISRTRAGERLKRLWFGTEKAHGFFREAVVGKLSPEQAAAQILADAAEHPRLFSRPEDGSIAAWVERLGCYSPILHLQQSDGVSSPHWPFSPEYNRRGVVSGEAFMESLGRAFAREDAPGMPPQVDEVALTLEPFLGTMANVYDAVEEIAQSVAYWRRFVPRDGMRLSEALALMKA